MLIEIQFRVTTRVYMGLGEKGLDYIQSGNSHKIRRNSSNKYNILITAEERHSSAAIITPVVYVLKK